MFDENKKISEYKEQKAFVEFIQFCESNRHLFKNIHDNKSKLTPLVGAGLSVDFGYPSWTKFFEDMCEEYLNPLGNAYKEIKDILAKIQNDEKLNNEYETFYTRMADLAIKEVGATLFFEYLHGIFKEEKGAFEKLEESAAHSIAKTFKGLCLTTNFDRTMEKAYGIEKRNDVFSPGEEEKIKQYNQGKPKDQKNDFLFHLHGSVKDVYSYPERIVLNTESYKKYYSDKNKFMQMLPYEIIFYLGIGLENEEPFIKFFKDSLAENRCHFAIYNADTKKDAEELQKNLIEKQKIQALIYPKDEYAYVKYILDWLRKDNPTGEDINNWLKRIDDEFDWSDKLIYFDDQENLKKLGNFLDENTNFSYAEISGGIWSGKTRLANELKKYAEKKNWKVEFFDVENSDSLTSPLDTTANNILYILDNATIYDLTDEDKDEDKDKHKIRFVKYLMNLAKSKKKVRVVFIYTSIEKTDKWWKMTMENVFKVNPEEVYRRNIISLNLSKSTAENIIFSFADTHGRITQEIDAEKIKKCFESWKKLIENEEISTEIQIIINSPLGCMLMTSILLSRDGIEEEKIIEKARKILIRKGSSESDLDKLFLLIKKQKEQINLIVIRRENIYATPPTSPIDTAEINMKGKTETKDGETGTKEGETGTKNEEPKKE